MTDKEKIQALLNLLTDSEVARCAKAKQITELGTDEFFGAMVFASYALKKAHQITNQN